MRKQDNRDHGEHRPSPRSSREESPEQARQARHEEGQRWVRMDADDATWARTPEERAWRELNTVTKAEQAAAPEADADKRFRLSDLFAFQPEQKQEQKPGQLQETSERPLIAGAARQEDTAHSLDSHADYNADIQVVYDAARHEASSRLYDDYISNYPLYANYSNYYLIDDYYLADDYYYLPAYYPEYYATESYTQGHTTTYAQGYMNNANDLLFSSLAIDCYQSHNLSQPYEALVAESIASKTDRLDYASMGNPSFTGSLSTQSYTEETGHLKGRSDYLHASAAAVVAAPLCASFENASGLTVNPQEAYSIGSPVGLSNDSAIGAATSPLLDYPIGSAVNPIDMQPFEPATPVFCSPPITAELTPEAAATCEHASADLSPLYASFHDERGLTVNPLPDPSSGLTVNPPEELLYQSYQIQDSNHLIGLTVDPISTPQYGPAANQANAPLGIASDSFAPTPLDSPSGTLQNQDSLYAGFPDTSGLTVNPIDGLVSNIPASSAVAHQVEIRQSSALTPSSGHSFTHQDLVEPLYASFEDKSGLTVNPLEATFCIEAAQQTNEYLVERLSDTEALASGSTANHLDDLNSAAASLLQEPALIEDGGLIVNPLESPSVRHAIYEQANNGSSTALSVLDVSAVTSLEQSDAPQASKQPLLDQDDALTSGLTVNPLDDMDTVSSEADRIGAWFAAGKESPAASHIPAEDFLVTGPSKHQQAEGLLLEDENTLRLQGAAKQLSNSASAESVLSNDPFSPQAAQERIAASPSSSSKRPESRSKSQAARAELKAAGLGVAGLAGGAVLSGVKTTAGATNAVIERAMREDENLARVADTEDVLLDAVTNMREHTAGSPEGKHLIAELKGTRNPKVPSEDKLLKAKRATIREKASAVDGADLREKLNAEGALDTKPSALEEKPTGIRGKAVEAAQAVGAEEHLIGREGSEKPKKADAKSRFEKKLAKKRQDRLKKKDAKGKSALEAIKKPGVKTVLLAKGAAFSSAEKVLTKKNEELAIAVAMAKKARKVEAAVKAPVKIYRQAKTALSTAYHAVKGTVQGIIALGSSGPVGLVIVLVLFLLLVFAIAALIGSASVINDEQEISEVSALVAELDEQLTEEIHEMGAQGVLYCDARNTYGESDGSKDLTKDVDLADDKSDLKEVDAESVTVQTDPGEIVAYIDAKYTGKWQVGAASWKFTIDAFGATWNVIQWDNMPEWCWKALNKVSRENLRNKLSVRVFDILRGEYDVKVEEAVHLSEGIADEFANVLYDQQIQDINEEVLTQVISDVIKKQSSSLELSKKEIQKLYYELQDIVSEVIASKEPLAFVYDEIVALHADLNWWSEKYQSFEVTGDGEKAPAAPVEGTGSGTNNKSGYPNSTGYDEKELEKWGGFNEVSVYGISEAGTTSVTADGTKITNTWSDTNMAIACEGQQNEKYAYWSKAYRNATGLTDPKPVVITLYNPSTGKTVSAEVRDCGGWRGFNKKYAGMNADRQWDLLPAVWKALGGTPTSGLMKVCWKVDPNAVVGGGGELEPMDFEDYPWPKESDKGNGTITLNRPTLVVHSINDALNNDPLMDEIIGKDNYATKAEFVAIKNMVVTKVRDIMRGFLTMKNEKGDLYTDYLYFRRNLPSPFGEEKGNPRQWIIVKRFNPGYDDFDHDKVEIEVKPLNDVKDVYAIKKGIVRKVKDGKVTVRLTIDSKTSADVTYAELEDVTVKKLNKVKRGQKLGTMKSGTLKIAYYEVNTPLTRIHTNKKWAYDPGMFMLGFAGYKHPDTPKPYTGGSAMRDYSDCKTIVEFAQSRLGCPYVWGATGPDTFDCSGLTQWCYKQAGISIPRNSEGQHNAAVSAGNCHPINEADMQPGDIVWKSGHVGIYIGSNKYIHAPQSGDVVKVSVNVKSLFTHYLRFGNK